MQLDRLKKSGGRLRGGAQEAINWLDEVTSDSAIGARVLLQGGEEEYKTWEEVEKHLLPVTLFSMEETDHEVNSVASQLESSLITSDEWEAASAASAQSFVSQVGEHQAKTPSSPISSFASLSPPLSTANTNSRPGTAESSDSLNYSVHNGIVKNKTGNGAAIPAALKPLFNYIMWRVNQEPNSEAALQSYVLLTNDRLKQTIAQRFGIRARRLEHLRDVLSREERDYRNRMQLYKKEHPDAPLAEAPPKKSTWSPPIDPATISEDPTSDDEDVVLLQRRGSIKASTAEKALPAPVESTVIDPDEFSRGPTSGAASNPPTPRESRENGSGRGGRRNGGRGRSANGSPQKVKAARPTSAGRGGAGAGGSSVVVDEVIDPDSFKRPAAAGRGRGFGGTRRKLWEPS